MRHRFDFGIRVTDDSLDIIFGKELVMARIERQKISRRDFLKNAGIVAGGTAAGGLLAGCSTTPSASGQRTKWDYESDVVIIGLGGAGAAAAIEAHDAGAKVLILEKQAENHHFCNTRMAGGVWNNPDPSGDRRALVEYIKATMSGDNVPGKLEGEMPDRADELAEMFATGIMEVESFLLQQAPDLDRAVMAAGGDSSFPMLPGFKEAKYGRTVGTRYKDFANADPSVKNYKRPREQKSNGEAFFHALVEDGIKSKRPAVEIRYSTKVKKIIRIDQGDVQGVVATGPDGRDINIKAGKAVILTTGGFEYNVEMRRAFLEGPGVKGWGFYGSPDNTGDGIKMALQINARMVKVSKSSGRIESAWPYGEAWDKEGLKMGASTTVTSSRNSIIVDNYGKRYTDEHIITDATRSFRYEFYKEALLYDLHKMNYPRVPSWVIFDETRRAAGPVVGLDGSTPGYDFLPWAADNLDAINKGWILKGNTIEELVAKIKADPENRELIDVANVTAAIQRFNEFCVSGNDLDFGRTPATMGPVQKPPFYALKLYPGGPNTKGGIDADAKRQVIDWEGKPIPRLYSAGEISSIVKFLYQAGAHLTECIVCGRVAGKNAAALTSWG
jgi:succinate dehydrogenase/fumarate reductase flavoprotein subunit